MWFTFLTARLFISPCFQPRLAATLLRSCSVVNSPTRRVGLAPTFLSASLAQAPFAPVQNPRLSNPIRGQIFPFQSFSNQKADFKSAGAIGAPTVLLVNHAFLR